MSGGVRGVLAGAKHGVVQCSVWRLVQGASTLSSSKNPSTRFYICSFIEREDSNSVLYPVLYILTIFPTSVARILTDRQCKGLSGRVSSQ